MKRRILSLALSCLVAIALGGTALAGMDDWLSKGLDSQLGKQLGLSSDQTKGGMGAFVGLAKEKLSTADYDKLAGAIPGADKYLSKAKKMGVLDKPLENTSGLNAALSKLGIPEDKVAQFVPAVKGLVGQLGGPEIQGIMSKFLD
jgi:hypothetical protein